MHYFDDGMFDEVKNSDFTNGQIDNEEPFGLKVESVVFRAAKNSNLTSDVAATKMEGEVTNYVASFDPAIGIDLDNLIVTITFKNGDLYYGSSAGLLLASSDESPFDDEVRSFSQIQNYYLQSSDNSLEVTRLDFNISANANRHDYYVSSSSSIGFDPPDGSMEKPYRTITEALEYINNNHTNDNQEVNVHVATGTYGAATGDEDINPDHFDNDNYGLVHPANINIIGGYDTSWQPSNNRSEFKSALELGSGLNVTIENFDITSGLSNESKLELKSCTVNSSATAFSDSKATLYNGEYGNLTMSDSSVNGGIISSSAVTAIRNRGKLTVGAGVVICGIVESTIITTPPLDSSYGIDNVSGTVTVNSSAAIYGVMSHNVPGNNIRVKYAHGIRNGYDSASGALTINDGAIYGASGDGVTVGDAYAIQNNNSSAIEILGGKLCGIANNAKSTETIGNGNLPEGVFGIFTYGGTINISGGEIYGANGGGNMNYNAMGIYSNSASSSITISGGKIYGAYDNVGTINKIAYGINYGINEGGKYGGGTSSISLMSETPNGITVVGCKGNALPTGGAIGINDTVAGSGTLTLNIENAIVTGFEGSANIESTVTATTNIYGIRLGTRPNPPSSDGLLNQKINGTIKDSKIKGSSGTIIKTTTANIDLTGIYINTNDAYYPDNSPFNISGSIIEAGTLERTVSSAYTSGEVNINAVEVGVINTTITDCDVKSAVIQNSNPVPFATICVTISSLTVKNSTIRAINESGSIVSKNQNSIIASAQSNRKIEIIGNTIEGGVAIVGSIPTLNIHRNKIFVKNSNEKGLDLIYNSANNKFNIYNNIIYTDGANSQPVYIGTGVIPFFAADNNNFNVIGNTLITTHNSVVNISDVSADHRVDNIAFINNIFYTLDSSTAITGSKKFNYLDNNAVAKANLFLDDGAAGTVDNVNSSTIGTYANSSAPAGNISVTSMTFEDVSAVGSINFAAFKTATFMPTSSPSIKAAGKSFDINEMSSNGYGEEVGKYIINNSLQNYTGTRLNPSTIGAIEITDPL